MAGVEKEFEGEASPASDLRRLSTPGTETGRNVNGQRKCRPGHEAVTDLLADYEKVSASFTDTMDPDAMEKALNRQSELQEKIEAVNGWELDHQLEIAMDALRCPPVIPPSRSFPAEKGGDRPLQTSPAIAGSPASG